VPAGIPDTQILAVHPTQLYEIGIALVMFYFLWTIGARAHRQGQLFGLFMVMYAIERFLIEFVRAKGDRILLGLSTAQIASMIVLALGLWLLNRPGAPPAPKVEPREQGEKRRTSRANR
jgi:phosphatidylglycerol:prolipoprotein diacylglycerol transferase